MSAVIDALFLSASEVNKFMKLKISFLLLLSLLGWQSIFAQTTAVDGVKYFDENKRWYNDFTEHWFQFYDIPESDVREAIVHWEQIGDELKSSADENQGTYENGMDTHGDYIRWSAKSGFVWLVVNKCNGGPVKITRGKVLITQSAVKLIPEKVLISNFPHGNHQSNLKETEFLFVKWRGANFLIEPSAILNFADYTAGLNPSTSCFQEGGACYFSKVRQNYSGPEYELPIFPAGYEKLVKKPFTAKIISIGKPFRRTLPKEFDEQGKEIEQNYDELVTEVKIDLGKSTNIISGIDLRFLPENDNYTYEAVTVTKVYDKYSVAEYTLSIPSINCKKSDVENCEAENGKNLKVGQVVSTVPQ